MAAVAAPSTWDILFGEYDFEKARHYCGSLESFSIKLAVVYMAVIFSIKYFMKDRKPIDTPQVQTALNAWNALLCVFSGLGFLFTFPTFLSVAFTKGWAHPHLYITECFTSSRSGYWVLLWVLSKIPELVDTIFITIRKRPLMFMHWYHHALTGYYALVCFHEKNAHLIYVVWANYLIHFFMYGYYMLRSLKVKVPPQVAQLITTGQMVQFTIAILAQLHVGALSAMGGDYAMSFKGWFIGLFMLVTYFYLWIQFYKESYYNKGGKKYIRHQEETKTK